MRATLFLLVLVVCFAWSFAGDKCEDKKKDKCKDMTARKCYTKGDGCKKSCHMCAEGEKKVDKSPHCWFNLQRSGCGSIYAQCPFSCKGFAQPSRYNPYGQQQRPGYPGMQQPGGYGAQQGGYGAQQGGYGAQQGGYGAQQGGYGTQQGRYGAQQGGYGAQQGGYGAQQGGYNAQQGGYRPYDYPTGQTAGTAAPTGDVPAATVDAQAAATAKPADGLFRKHKLEKTEKKHHKKSKLHHRHHHRHHHKE